MLRNSGSPWLLIASLVFVSSAVSFSQAPTIAAPAQSPPSMPPVAFDVATIRPSGPVGDHGWFGAQSFPSGRFEARLETLTDLITFAYTNGPEKIHVVGGSGWLDTENWDIEAKADDASLAGLTSEERTERVRMMLQSLLRDRFQLRMHTEKRITPVYDLIQARGGSKLTEVPRPAKSTAQSSGDNSSSDRPSAGTLEVSSEGWTAHAVRMTPVVNQLGFAADDPGRFVIDKTGLTGYYDFSITFTHEKNGPTEQEQIEDQLGLRLVPDKMPIETYIIDSAEKPTPN